MLKDSFLVQLNSVNRVYLKTVDATKNYREQLEYTLAT